MMDDIGLFIVVFLLFAPLAIEQHLRDGDFDWLIRRLNKHDSTR